MSKTLPLWAALPFGAICGAILGTIVASFYLSLALRTGLAGFDMLAVWKASAGLRAAHPDAFKVAYGAVGFGTIGLGVLALAWTWKKERDEYGSAHWQTKTELAKNDMLHSPGKGFVCGKLGSPKSKGGYISSAVIPHVMMVAPTRAGTLRVNLSRHSRPIAAIGRLAWMLPLQPALQSFATPKKICGTLTSRLHLDILNSPIGN